MTNKLSDVQLDKFKAIIIGDQGSGKTTLAATAPGRQYWFCFEPGLLSVRTAHPEWEDRLDYDEYLLSPEPKEMHLAFERAYNMLTKERTKLMSYNVIVLDSLLSLSEAIFEFCKGKYFGKAGQPLVPEKGQDFRPVYQALAQYGWQFINGLATLPNTSFLLVSHEDFIRDDTTGAMYYGMSCLGQALPMRLPKMFDEIWRTVSTVTNDGVQSVRVQTRGGNQFKAKSRLGCFDQFEQPNISEMITKATNFVAAQSSKATSKTERS